MPARLAGTVRRSAQCHQGCQRRESWCRCLSCHLCPDDEGGADGLDDAGPAADEETADNESAGVGVETRLCWLRVGEDDCIGDWSERVGTGDDDALVGVGLGDLVVDGLTRQVGAFESV